ncbi:MAG: CARDB domain-containing protein [Bacteroidales bacterium]
MRKIFLLTLLLSSSYLLRSQSIVINMDTLTANPGDSVTVPVYAHNFTNAGSFTFYINFNSTVLTWGRVANWNPALLNGVHLGNASGNQLAVVWADINGANIIEDKLFDLKFKYNNGSSILDFTNQCEITDLMGNPVINAQFVDGYVTRRINVLLHADPPALCFGDSTQLSFVVQGGLGSYTFAWSSDPSGFSSDIENPIVIPGNTTIYQVMVTDGFDTAYDTQEVTVYFFVTPSPVENMIPADGAVNLNLPVLFTWTPPADATSYDLYVWEDGSQEPTDPLIANITQINYLLSTFLQYGKTYHWKVSAKNPCLETTGPVQTFTVRDLPDLMVNGINTPPQVYSGQTINVEFQIKNIGLGSTLTAQWIDAVYLSTDTTLETDIDHFVGTYQNLTYLGPQQAYNQIITFTLPQGISGYYYIIVKTDHNNSLLETNDNNNTSHNLDTMLVYLSPVPDLRVAKIIVQNSAFSGQPVSITWHVKNFGLANTGNLSWNDRVYFSQDEVFNSSAVNLGTFSHSGDLPQDSLYIMTRTIGIPNYIFGRFYFYVVTDVYNQVYEHALENNNMLQSDSIVIYLTPPPDLVTTAVIAPPNASNRENVTIQWTVQNQGVNPATGNWYDRIYITNSLTLNTSTAFFVGSVIHHGPLAPDDAYTTSLQVTIPSQITGQYYFFVFTDALLNVFEFNQEENNIKRCNNATNILGADLISTQFVVPATGGSGQSVSLSYYSTNQGQGKIIGNWIDRIYISAQETFSELTSTLIKVNVFNDQLIPSGDSILRNFSLVFPDGISGTFYLFIVSDFNNTIFEPGHEDNNVTRSQPIIIELTPWPDLVVTDISYSEDTVTPGFPFELTYTIKNQGPGPLTGIPWFETLSLSANYSVMHPVVYSFKVWDSVTLLPNESFSRTITVIIPSYVSSGNYYWWVKTDSDNSVYEHTDEGNNQSPGLQIFVEPYPPVDLVAANLSYPGTGMSGSIVPINWTVQNDGSVPTIHNYWRDFFYLSPDTLPNPETDIYIGFVDNSIGLNPGNSYTKNISVALPNGISGIYYLYIYADRDNRNHDANLANNIGFSRDNQGIPVPIEITLTPPPDLAFISFNCPSVGLTGQPLTVSWEVKNQGAGPIQGGIIWYDNIYLSTDFNLGNEDYLIISYARSEILPVGASYTRTESFTIPNWAIGNYIILIKTDASNTVYEMTNENNNLANQVITLQVPPPSDLLVTQIIPPTEAFTGQNIILTWTLKNIGVNPATGYMSDMVYFSMDTLWDIDDVLFNTVYGYISIGPNAEFNRSCNGIISELVPGDYYVIVRTDARNHIPEGNDDNNTTWSVQQITITVPELPINTWVDNTLRNYIPLLYRLEIPASLAGETMQIRLMGDSISGSNEMYLKLGTLPSRTTYDYSYSNPNYGNQDILIPFLSEGTYYLMVYGSTAGGNTQQIKLHARILNFQILSVDDNSGGNTGNVTLKLTGSKFTSNMQVYLVKGENKILGTGYQFIDASKAYITFELDDAELGFYSVMATKFCDGIAILENAFEVVQGSAPDLQVNSYQPSGIRPNGIATIVIEYFNNGNVDLLAPEIEFISLDGAPVSLTVTGLSEGLTSLLLPLRENNGPSTILRPGIGGTITIYAKATKSLAFLIRLPNYD